MEWETLPAVGNYRGGQVEQPKLRLLQTGRMAWNALLQEALDEPVRVRLVIHRAQRLIGLQPADSDDSAFKVYTQTSNNIYGKTTYSIGVDYALARAGLNMVPFSLVFEQEGDIVYVEAPKLFPPEERARKILDNGGGWRT